MLGNKGDVIAPLTEQAHFRQFREVCFENFLDTYEFGNLFVFDLFRLGGLGLGGCI